jgi:anaerobic selenocysteine-containing dehydrogenase
VSLVSYQISGAFPASDRPAFEELSQRLLAPVGECGEEMWMFCKELQRTDGTTEGNQRKDLAKRSIATYAYSFIEQGQAFSQKSFIGR